MKYYIENPIKQKDWDPTKGDFFSERMMEEDQLHLSRKKRKRIFIAFLTFIHVAFLSIILFLY